jgi:hypothetical protein
MVCGCCNRPLGISNAKEFARLRGIEVRIIEDYLRGRAGGTIVYSTLRRPKVKRVLINATSY